MRGSAPRCRRDPQAEHQAGYDMPRRRRKASTGAEHFPEIPARPPDARHIRRPPQCSLRRLKALDDATHYLWGCSFQQFIDVFFSLGYDRGYSVGFKEGRAAGRRAAKGLPPARKKRGRPPTINESLASLLVLTVEERKKHGDSVKDAVRYLLNVMREGAKELNAARAETNEPQIVDKLPTVQEAERTYYRIRKKPRTPLF